MEQRWSDIDERKLVALVEKPVPVLPCLSHVPHALTWERTQNSAVTCSLNGVNGLIECFHVLCYPNNDLISVMAVLPGVIPKLRF